MEWSPTTDEFAAQKVTASYAADVGRAAYLWGWPLVNMRNRRLLMEKVPEPGLLAGIAPVAPPGRLCMLRDYVQPQERLVACPNQDVVYGFGLLDAHLGPVVVQMPNFGDRFWVCQAIDQRTDSFVELGAMYGTAPGHYLLAPATWDGEVPDGIAAVFRYDTRVAVVIPRVFMDDTDNDRAAIAALIEQINVYPLQEYDGTLKTADWARVPSYDAGDTGDGETQWVDPDTFFDVLGETLDEVPPMPGEEALYDWLRVVLDAASRDAHVAAALKQAALDTDATVTDLFEFRHFGLPAAHHWSTQRSGAAFGTDYLMRTAVAKSNIFVNTANETSYYYLDLDTDGARLHGSHTYSVTFDPGQVPPVKGFWSLTVYNKHHFFHPNDLHRYSLGTKNQNLTWNGNGSLTLTVGGDAPDDPAISANWLPAPAEEFTLFLRAYWPDDTILDGTWQPPGAVPRQKEIED